MFVFSHHVGVDRDSVQLRWLLYRAMRTMSDKFGLSMTQSLSEESLSRDFQRLLEASSRRFVLSLRAIMF